MKTCNMCKHHTIVQRRTGISSTLNKVYLCTNEALAKDIVTGQIIPQDCKELRNNETLCGKDGKHFT